MPTWLPTTLGEIVALLFGAASLLGIGRGVQTGGLKRWGKTIVAIYRANVALEECRQQKEMFRVSLQEAREELALSRVDFGVALRAGSGTASPPSTTPATPFPAPSSKPRSRRRRRKSSATGAPDTT